MFANHSTIPQRKGHRSLFNRKVDYQTTNAGATQNLPCLKITIVNSPSRQQDERRQRIAQPLQWTQLEVSRLQCDDDNLSVVVPRDQQQAARREPYQPLFQAPIAKGDPQNRAVDDFYADSRRQEYRSSREQQSAIPQGVQHPPQQQRPQPRAQPMERRQPAHLRSLGVRSPVPARGYRPAHRDAPRPKIGVRPRFQVQRSQVRLPARLSAPTREELPISTQRTYRTPPHRQNYYADRQQEIRPRRSLFSGPTGRRFDQSPAGPFRGVATQMSPMSRRFDRPSQPMTQHQAVRREIRRSPAFGASATARMSPPRDRQTNAVFGDPVATTSRVDAADGELEDGEVEEGHPDDADDEEPTFEYLDDNEEDELEFLDADPYTLEFV